MTDYEEYIAKIDKLYQSGRATEHSYRPRLLTYLENLIPEFVVTNEPTRQAVGAPDLIITNQLNIPVAYLETKPVGDDMNKKIYAEQFSRYCKGLDVVIINDYMEFRFFRNNVLTETVHIAELKNDKVVACADGKARFEYLIQQLATPEHHVLSIKSAADLAVRMADKAKLFADVLFRALQLDDSDFELAEGSLKKQYNMFKTVLLPDLSHAEFADLYAQTVAFGLFAARLHDPTLQDFSRQEALELIPKKLKTIKC